MKKLFFTTVLIAVLTTSYSQFNPDFRRHYWLNETSYNYTLSYPTPNPNGKWLLAAARQDLKNNPNKYRNTIAVFRLDNAYNLVGNVRVIGYPGTGNNFSTDVDFDVHCIVESCNNDAATGVTHVIICGAKRNSGIPSTQVGVVIVLDANSLNPISIREYPSVRNFYSVYAENGRYYVCGQTTNWEGVVLQDNILTTSPTGFVTNEQWDYHKIKVRANPCSSTFSVSGSNKTTEGTSTEIGYTVFNTGGSSGSLTYGASYKFHVNPPIINSKAVIANYPGPASQGVILSVSDASYIYTYLIGNYSTPTPPTNSAFRLPCQDGILEDVDCGQNPRKIAWVGNIINTAARKAYYVTLNLPTSFPPIPSPPPPSPFPATPATFYYFNPSPISANAYYSLHKVLYDKQDAQFHAGGYYNSDTNNKATFVVTPERSPVECHKIEDCIMSIEHDIPDPHPFDLRNYDVEVVSFPPICKEYKFCEMDCLDDEDIRFRGNRIKK